MKKFAKIAASALAFAPMLAFAAVGGFETLLNNVSAVGKWVIGFMILMAVAYFIWGVIGYISTGADKEKREEARNMMIYGIIGLFVIVSIWGLVTLVGGFVGVNAGSGTVPNVVIPNVTI